MYPGATTCRHVLLLSCGLCLFVFVMKVWFNGEASVMTAAAAAPASGAAVVLFHMGTTCGMKST
jgi:hypothetical protein